MVGLNLIPYLLAWQNKDTYLKRPIYTKYIFWFDGIMNFFSEFNEKKLWINDYEYI